MIDRILIICFVLLMFVLLLMFTVVDTSMNNKAVIEIECYKAAQINSNIKCGE